MGEGGQQTTALVVEADAPLDNRVIRGKKGLGLLRILLGDRPDPVCAGAFFRLDHDHWPVRGMELPVTLDSADPGGFEVLWDAVPGIEQRVAANDPALADPLGTRNRTMGALHASGATPLLRLPDGRRLQQDQRGMALIAEAAALAARDDSLEGLRDSIDGAAREPAPAGKRRAVVLIATSAVTLRNMGDDQDRNAYTRDRHGKHAAVLAVNLPGEAPYAVFDQKFKHPSGKSPPAGPGLPALVSAADPVDVQVLWEEMPSIKEQNRRTATAAMQDAHSLEEFTRGAPSPPGPPATPTGGTSRAPGMAQMPANMQAMIAQNAKAALAATTDPAMRKLLIDQYRAAGIEIDEDDVAG